MFPGQGGWWQKGRDENQGQSFRYVRVFEMLTFVQLTTNGSNFQGLWQFSAGSDESILEDDEIYSNDIYAILMTYGVEMARAAILQEMGAVFGAYKIQVDQRHLELIADYMVCGPTSCVVSFLMRDTKRHLRVVTKRSIARVSHPTPRHCSKHRTR
jgi:hypothetical protein